jgi:hypothetical protein
MLVFVLIDSYDEIYGVYLSEEAAWDRARGKLKQDGVPDNDEMLDEWSVTEVLLEED